MHPPTPAAAATAAAAAAAAAQLLAAHLGYLETLIFSVSHVLPWKMALRLSGATIVQLSQRPGRGRVGGWVVLGVRVGRAAGLSGQLSVALQNWNCTSRLPSPAEQTGVFACNKAGQMWQQPPATAQEGHSPEAATPNRYMDHHRLCSALQQVVPARAAFTKPAGRPSWHPRAPRHNHSALTASLHMPLCAMPCMPCQPPRHEAEWPHQPPQASSGAAAPEVGVARVAEEAAGQEALGLLRVQPLARRQLGVLGGLWR